MAERYKPENAGETSNQRQEVSLFNGKLRLINRDCFNLGSDEDVLIVPCHPDILSGGHVFNTVYEKLGDTMTAALQPYLCMEPGACKLIQTSDLLSNYKKLAMCVLPELYENEGLTRVDRFKVSMCIADALDLAAESSAENVVLTHWPIASFEQSAEILLLCLAHWIRYSVYFDRIKRISVALDGEDLFSVYYEVAKVIEEDPSLILDVLQERRSDEYGGEQAIEQEAPDTTAFLEKSSVYTTLNNSRGVQDRRSNNQNGSSPFLFYSRNLSTSILSIEQSDNTIRQYRLSTTVAEKNSHYFRCSRCDYLSRNNEDMGQFRPKITVRDGVIVSNRFPDHHPMCRSVPKEKFVLQQLDRLWKSVAIYETEELRGCYNELRDIAQKEASPLYLEMEESTGRFPEWEMLKEMAEKYHSHYPIRLVKFSPNVPSISGVDMEQYSEIRRVEDEIDGVVKDATYAWITEGVDEEDEEAANEEAIKPSVVIHGTSGSSSRARESTPDYSDTVQTEKPSTRPQRTVRSTYNIRSGQQQSSSSSTGASNSVRFRIIKPQKSSPPQKRSRIE